MATKASVIGIDLGASTSFVAFVGKGIVDLVQNEVSQRATSTLVGFTDRERLVGDSALAQIRSNAKNTCRNFKHLLGRRDDASDVETERFWSTCKLAACDDGFAGYNVTYKGEERIFSPVQVAAMFLTQLRDITEKWCQAKVADAVISVPAGYSDVHRQALLDAAKIAGISVLRLMNEHTATALAYGIYRSNDFDPDTPINVAFCSMGHSIFSVSIVQFIRGKLTVLCEKSEKVGGRDMDECLMREFADRFKKKTGRDPLSNKKAAFKLEDAVSKTKKTLSANSEASVSVECLMEDEDFSSTINRDEFERMCQPMMDRVRAVLEGAVRAVDMPLDRIESVEIVGGACRVPWLKRLCSEVFGGKELSTTMNADESVARGCALQAAMLSPLYKVRDFRVEDSSPFAVTLGWLGRSTDAIANMGDNTNMQTTEGDGEYKTLPIFPAGSTMNLIKMLTFYRKDSFEMKAEYTDEEALLPGTAKGLGSFRIELPEQSSAKKIKVQAKLSLHGMLSIESAQMLEEEEVEETVKERRELSPEPVSEDEVAATDTPMTDAKLDDKKDEKPDDQFEQKPVENPNEKSNEKPDEKLDEEPDEKPDETMANGDVAAPDKEKDEVHREEPESKPAKKREPEKRYEWIDVVKKRQRCKRTDLKIMRTGNPGFDKEVLQKLMDEETAMQTEMREVIETDARRNDLESYILTMRDKLGDDHIYSPYISEADRDKFNAELTKAEDWLYDNERATKVQFIDKLEELKSIGEPVVWRFKEDGMRADWIAAVLGTISNYRNVTENPGEKYGHIAPANLAKITTACDELAKWLADAQAAQEKLPKTARPELICADMEKRNQELARTADGILKEPKPAPKKKDKKDKNENKDENNEEAAKEDDKQTLEPESEPQNMDVE